MNELDEFNSILEKGNKIELLNYFEEENNCKFIIDNKLFLEKINIISKYFNKNITKSVIKKLLKSNINFINSNNFIELINMNFDTDFYIQLLTYLKNNDICLEKYLDVLTRNKIPFDIIKFLVYEACRNKYDIDNFVISFNELILYLDYFKKDEKIYNVLSNSINRQENIFLKNILIYSLNISSKEIEEEKIMPYFKRIVDEVLEYEGKMCSDIRLIGEGGSSCVYKMGNKVLKLGRSRLGFKIDNNKRFLCPLLRQDIKSIKDDTLFFIEITEKVKTDNISEEDAYSIYKELRDEGLVWLDCYPANLGRLIKPNKIYFKDELNPFKEAINYNTDLKEELDSGELVILDNELIFKEKDFFDKFGFSIDEFNGNDTIFMYENRYQKEKKRTINF